MIIEFTQTIANIDMPMVAMFNECYISEEFVREHITKYGPNIGYNAHIVYMTKEQYENLKDPETLEFYEDLKLEQQGGII
jgi:hypothetical protein